RSGGFEGAFRLGGSARRGIGGTEEGVLALGLVGEPSKLEQLSRVPGEQQRTLRLERPAFLRGDERGGNEHDTAIEHGRAERRGARRANRWDTAGDARASVR